MVESIAVESLLSLLLLVLLPQAVIPSAAMMINVSFFILLDRQD
jgi:hypothetical protein